MIRQVSEANDNRVMLRAKASIVKGAESKDNIARAGAAQSKEGKHEGNRVKTATGGAWLESGLSRGAIGCINAHGDTIRVRALPYSAHGGACAAVARTKAWGQKVMAHALLRFGLMNYLQSVLAVIQGGLSCAGSHAMKKTNVNDNRALARSKVDNNISYQTLAHGPTIAQVGRVPSDRPIVPISNLPLSAAEIATEKRDFTIYRLKRRLADAQHENKLLLKKLTRTCAGLEDQLRFFEVGLHHDQWETLGELHSRVVHLKALISYVRDPMAGYEPDPSLQQEIATFVKTRQQGDT
jgi:hypothetical protein